MQKAIIGKKVGMTQIFDESGKVIPVTVVEAGPCVVTQKKTVETDGYVAVGLNGLLLGNDAGACFHDGHRDHLAALIEDLGHTHFFADDCFLHGLVSPFL